MAKRSDKFTELDCLLGEWIVTNGLGGFASNSICGAPNRKYHGLLVAALPAPFGRTIMLNYIEDQIVLPDKSRVPLSLLAKKTVEPKKELPLAAFFNEDGLPIWHYKIDDTLIEKRVYMINCQNTVHISYEIISESEPVELKWSPFFHFRRSEEPVNSFIPNEIYSVKSRENFYDIECPEFPPLRLCSFSNSNFTFDKQILENVFYETEAKRGY